jgi:hypothetical protein
VGTSAKNTEIYFFSDPAAMHVYVLREPHVLGCGVNIERHNPPFFTDQWPGTRSVILVG